MPRIPINEPVGADVVRLGFPWNHYASGEPTRGIDAGKMKTVRMRRVVSRKAKYCTACGAPIPAGAEHWTPDWAGDSVTSVDIDCPNARTIGTRGLVAGASDV